MTKLTREKSVAICIGYMLVSVFDFVGVHERVWDIYGRFFGADDVSRISDYAFGDILRIPIEFPSIPMSVLLYLSPVRFFWGAVAWVGLFTLVEITDLAHDIRSYATIFHNQQRGSKREWIDVISNHVYILGPCTVVLLLLLFSRSNGTNNPSQINVA